MIFNPEFSSDCQIEAIVDYKSFMQHQFRLVVCPTGELVFVKPDQFQSACNDLASWSIGIRKFTIDQ